MLTRAQYGAKEEQKDDILNDSGYIEKAKPKGQKNSPVVSRVWEWER